MKIPSELGTLEDLKRREAQAFKHATHWTDTLDDAYEYFLPNRNLFEETVASLTLLLLRLFNKVQVSYKKT